MTDVTNSPKLHDCRDAFVAVLERLGADNPKIVAVCNDSVVSSKLGNFKSKWPERLVNVGIAEQTMVGVGAGLANGGLLPFVCGAACFLTGRSLEQIKADIAYSNANVKLIGISSGMAYGELGPTHHSIEDFAWTRVIPNLPVIAPCDSIETAAAVEWAARYDGPVFLRLSRVGVPDLLPANHTFELGKAKPAAGRRCHYPDCQWHAHAPDGESRRNTVGSKHRSARSQHGHSSSDRHRCRGGSGSSDRRNPDR